MLVLIATCLVQCIAIRAVGQRRAFVLDRVVQHIQGRLMNAAPLSYRELIATHHRMDVGDIQYLGGILVSDPGNRLLIEQRHLHCTAT